MRWSAFTLGCLAAACCGAAALAAAAPAPPAAGTSAEAIEFFEKSVRPLLVESCYSCHGPKIQQAGLRLDSLAAMLKGSDGGKPALKPGDPEHSPLIQAVRHTGAVKMPPSGKLAPEKIAALEQWVRMGAPWPEQRRKAEGGRRKDGDPLHPSSPILHPLEHWAFQPVRLPAVPKVRNRAWVKTPIDAFVLAKLEVSGLSPAPPADRRTLMRRAYLDLTGLPPSAEEVEHFVKDPSPDAWAKVVDRLLASSRYGERWGRYWLDVARYADTKGYVFQEERRYPNAWTYRDYVVRSFNEDKPYDRFLTEQIAADHLELGDDKRPLAAMGFLTLGRRFLNNQPDIIDDRLDVLFRGTQALTVACARCHDHKFDPIPTADYYSLYGVFASSVEPRDQPLIEKPDRNAAYLAYEKQLNELQAKADAFLAGKRDEVLKRARERIGAALLATAEPDGNVRALAQKYDLPFMLIPRWKEFLAGKERHPIFGPWHAFASLPAAQFAEKAPGVSALFAADGQTHPKIAQLFKDAPQSLQQVAERYQQLLASPPAGDQQLVNALDSIGGPLEVKIEDVQRLLQRDERNQFQALQQKVDSFKAGNPNGPARAMALADAPNPVNPRIFRRGNANSPGDQVPRQFLAVLSGPNRKPFQKGSGRLELAQAIVDPKNPLTARVMVNRVWIGHFGAGLVRTPSDFGVRSDPPTHPELLDWLASTFNGGDRGIEGQGERGTGLGWSLKKLHRLILLSSTYQQSSANPQNAARAAKADPENNLLWRFNRRRLDFEGMWDSLLYVSGRLDETAGGAPVELTKAPFPKRRAIYGFIDRQNLPGMFRTFDFASPDQHSPQRFVTTVPQQALFMMNSPFFVEQARAVAARPEMTALAGPEQRIRQLYRLVYARDPAPQELEIGLRFIRSAEPTAAVIPASTGGGSMPLTPWEQYAQVLLMSNEFMFVD